MATEKLRRTYMEVLHERVQSFQPNIDKALKKTAQYTQFGIAERYRLAAGALLGYTLTLNTEKNIVDMVAVGTGDDAIKKETTWLGYTLMLSNFFMQDKKVFKLREGLVEKLKQTELSKMDFAFLKTPFKSIVFTADTPMVKAINEVYVSVEEIMLDGGIPAKRFSMTGIKNDGNLDIQDEDWAALNSVILKEGDILTQLKEVCVQKEAPEYQLASFVLTALLYMNSSHVELNPLMPKKSPYEKILRRSGEGNSTIPHMAVGDNVTIDRNWREVSESSGTQSNNPKHRLTPAWIVRGHFRKQRVGVNRADSKIIWIEPFVKGDISKHIHNKSYTVTV